MDQSESLGQNNEFDSLTSSENVRARVSSWLSNVVDEVRRKTPVPIPKWADNSKTSENISKNQELYKTVERETQLTEETNNSENNSEIEETEKTNIELSKIESEIKIENTVEIESIEESLKLSKSPERKIFESPQNENLPKIISELQQPFWKKINFERSSNSNTKVSQLRSLGRNKISEIYEKVNNKIRYSSNKAMENVNSIVIPSTLESNESSKGVPEGISEFSKIDEEKKVHPNNKKDKGIHLNISEEDLENSKFGQQCLNYLHSNNGTSISSLRPPISPEGTSSSHSYLLSPSNSGSASKIFPILRAGPICRSYSEQHDDRDLLDVIDETTYVRNERSRSFTHVIDGEGDDASNNNNKNMDNHNNNNNNIKEELDQVSSSLPNFYEKPPRKQVFRNRIHSAEPSEHRKNILFRDNSYQSDSSHCSSVDSLLEARKPDSEAILLNLGFGPIESEDILSRIPKRFLKPSQVRGCDTEAFLKRQQLANHIHDHSILGYRGLVGNPDLPPSSIVKKIMERFESNERNHCCTEMRPQSELRYANLMRHSAPANTLGSMQKF